MVEPTTEAATINEIQRSLGRIEGKLEDVLSAGASCAKDRKEHTEKIASLERYRSKVAGWIAAASAVSALIANYILKHL